MRVWTHDGVLLTLEEPPQLGGEAAVYFATGPDGACVAKVALRPSPAGDWVTEERERLEALGRDPETAPLVPRVLGHGIWGDRPFLVLERFPATLADHLNDALPARLEWAARAAEAVAALAAVRPGLVHRDLKPSNLLVDAERVVITDFGASREPCAASSTTTRALFTPSYAPPEQSLPHRTPDPSWDTFALAATLFHIVVGVPAQAPAAHTARLTERGRRLRTGHDDGRAPAWEYLRLDGPSLTPEDLRRLDALVHGPLRGALIAALSPDPRRRRGSAADLARAVRATRVARVRQGRPWVSLAVLALALAAFLRLAVPVSRPAPSYPMVRIPASAEGPAFLLGAREVDQALWRQLTGVDASRRRTDRGLGPETACDRLGPVSLTGDDLPMVCVDVWDAMRFANALSARDGLAPAYQIDTGTRIAGSTGYRLPTVEEWRRASGDDRRPPCSENVADRAFMSAFRNGDTEPCDDGYGGPAPVGTFPSGPFGVLDLHGNAAEWLDDRPGPDRHWVSGGRWNWGEAGARVPVAVSDRERSPVTGVRLARSLP